MKLRKKRKQLKTLIRLNKEEFPKRLKGLLPPRLPDGLAHLENTTKFRARPARLEKKINQYIRLRMENGRTHIYVNGIRFIQCIRLILNIPSNDVHVYEEIESIDEAVKLHN